MKIDLSVIIPTKNEKNHIENFIESILKQDTEKIAIVYIFIDGGSKDGTIEIIESYLEKHDNFVLINNPKGHTPVSLNIGIRATNSDYIMRLDAHSIYPENYISILYEQMKKDEYQNIGGRIITKGEKFFGKMHEVILESRFGVGNSAFRTSNKSGIVDTVPFGIYKRETLDRIGYYDERLLRNQDLELNSRLRDSGYKIYLDSKLVITYFCKNKLLDILKQAYMNGFWNIILAKINVSALSIRHFIPLIFVLFTIFCIPFAFFFTTISLLYAYTMVVYFILSIYFSLRGIISKKLNIIYMLFLPFMFFCFHFSYGLGSLVSSLSRRMVKNVA